MINTYSNSSKIFNEFKYKIKPNHNLNIAKFVDWYKNYYSQRSMCKIYKEKLQREMKINLIAEIGWNYIRDITLAEKMIKQAKKSGADYCKFQTWSEKLKTRPWDTDGRRE